MTLGNDVLRHTKKKGDVVPSFSRCLKSDFFSLPLSLLHHNVRDLLGLKSVYNNTFVHL